MGTELGRAAFALLFGGAGIFLIARSSKPARWTFAPVVSFEMEGNAICFTSAHSDTARAYEVGQTAMVRYLRGDPKSAELDTVTRAWWPLLGVLLLAVLCILVAALPYVLNQAPSS